MRVLKFGGTSVANAERFLRVADILESNARQGQVATVLSAPAKITNHLVAMIEKTIEVPRCFTQYQRCRTYFCRTSDGTRRRPAGISAGTIENFRRPGICPNKTCPAWH